MTTVREELMRHLTQSQMSSFFIDKMKIFNVKSYGAEGDGVTDDSDAIQDTINAAYAVGGGVVYFPYGTYVCLSLAGKDKVSFWSHAAILRKNGGAATTNILDLTGSTTSTSTTLTASAAIGDTAISVTSSSSFVAGDYVLVRDATYKYSTIGRNQEINRISSVAAGTINVVNRLIGSYATASSAEVVKLSPITDVIVKGLMFQVPAGTSGGCCSLVLNYGTIIEKCTATGPNNLPGFNVEQSAFVKLKLCHVKDGQDLAASSRGYGIQFNESCHNCIADTCTSENVRENTMTNNARFCKFVNCIDVSSYDSSFNTHGSGNDNCTIENCISISPKAYGVSAGYATQVDNDTNVTIKNCKVYNPGSAGIVSGAPNGQENQEIKIIGCEVYNPNVSVVGGNGIYVFEASGVEINGCSVYGSTNTSYGVLVANSDNIDIKMNTTKDLLNGYGIGYDTVANLNIENNTIENVSSFNVRSIGVNTNVKVSNNVADDGTLSLGATDRRYNNTWGTQYELNWNNSTGIADGGSISHGLVGTPRTVVANASVASEFVSVTAVGSTGFTVAIKKHDGTAGTSQTIYWLAIR
jgi:hypothetical protein